MTMERLRSRGQLPKLKHIINKDLNYYTLVLWSLDMLAPTGVSDPDSKFYHHLRKPGTP